MMGSSLLPQDVWRGPSSEAVSVALGLLRLLSDPKGAELAMGHIAAAQEALDKREQGLKVRENALADDTNALVAERSGHKAKADELADGWAKLKAEQDALDRQRRVLEQAGDDSAARHKKRMADLEREIRAARNAEAKAVARETEAAQLLVDVEAREKNIAQREAAIQVEEEALQARRARLEAALA